MTLPHYSLGHLQRPTPVSGIRLSPQLNIHTYPQPPNPGKLMIGLVETNVYMKSTRSRQPTILYRLKFSQT